MEVHTQGDSLRDSVTGELLDRETPRAKAFQCITIEVQDSKAVGNATFLSPPWVGSNGTLRKPGMSGQSGEALRGRYFWGCGVKPQVQPTSARPVSYSSGTILSLDDDPGLKSPVGRYRLLTPRQAEITLGPAQNYLDYPRISPVKGNDTTGYRVSWKPVPGAVAYAVSTYGGDTYWKNSDRDWQDLGVQKALEQGVLLRETTCLIPGGMYGETFRVSVDAISPDVFVAGDMPALGYSHSEKTLEVRPSIGAEPRNPDLAVEAEDKDADMRPKDPFRAAIFDGDFDRVSKMVESDPSLVNSASRSLHP